MNTDVLVPEGRCTLHDMIAAEMEHHGARLKIIARIADGLGVVPILEEVAVYREETPMDLPPGFYCIEHQRPIACSPHADSRRDVSREVVYVRPCRSVPGDGNWEYITLRSQVIDGVRRYAKSEGPIYWWAAGDLLLGPVIGIYSPNAFAGEC